MSSFLLPLEIFDTNTNLQWERLDSFKPKIDDLTLTQMIRTPRCWCMLFCGLYTIGGGKKTY